MVGSSRAATSSTSALIANSVDSLLDLTKPIQDGGTIVGIYMCAFRNNNMRFSEIRLPKTLASIGSIAFGDKSVGTTRVVFKSYPTIDGSAFAYGANAMLWTIPNDGSWDEFLASSGTFTPWTASMKSAWKFDGPKPLGKTVGFGCQWVRYPVGGMKLLFK